MSGDYNVGHYFAAAFRDAGVVELRALGPGVHVGTFDNYDALTAAVAALQATHNLYNTLNRPLESVEATNRMVWGASALKDADIERIVRLPIDLDPVRTKGRPSSETELSYAHGRQCAVANFLTSSGFPTPAWAMSGNGYHLIYRCSIPNSDEVKSALRSIYRGLASRFSDEYVTFDRTVYNPSRIFRLYGSINRKGEPDAERPHRASKIWVPDDWDAVCLSHLERLHDRIVPKERPRLHVVVNIDRRHSNRGDWRTLDIIAYFQSIGLYQFAYIDNKHIVTCPWAHEHTHTTSHNGSDTVVFEQGGEFDYPTFHCSHDHCAERGLIDVFNTCGSPDRFCAERWAP